MTAASRPIHRCGGAAIRRRLAGGTALALCALAISPAAAQSTLPQVSAGGDGGATISRDAAAGRMSVDLNGANRVVRYDSFNLGSPTSSSETLTFLNSGAAGNLSILNRVVAGSGSKIYGSIQAPDSITVWLVDPAGVTFGPTGSFSGGGLLVSTALLTPAQEAGFLAGTLTSLNDASTAPILFQSGSGTISARGAIVAVGQSISVDRPLASSAGSVALIAASDVSFTAPNSPLSFVVNRGTTLGTGVSVGANAAISGHSVVVAGGVDGAVTGALLKVDPGAAITATATDGKIVLATASSGGIFIASGGGTPGIDSAGSLRAAGSDGDVQIQAAGTALLRGSISAGRDVSLAAADPSAGTIAVAANVSAGRDYAVFAPTVTLGADGATSLQQANGAVTVNAVGELVGRGALTLQSNADGTGGEALQLLSSGGAVGLDRSTRLLGGTASDRSDVIVGSAPTIALGAVRARSLLSAGSTTTLQAGGDVSLGDVDVQTALDVNSASGSITAGNLLSSAGSVQLSAAGDIRLASARSGAGPVIIQSFGGDVSGLALAAPSTDGRLLAGFGRAALAAGAADQRISVTASSGTAQLGAVTAGAGASAVALPQIAVSAKAIDIASAAASNGAVNLSASGGELRAGSLAAGSAGVPADVVVSGSAGVTVAGDVAASGAYQVSGAAVTLGSSGAPATQSARGAVTIVADTGNITGLGSLTLQSNSDGTGAEPLTLRAAAAGASVQLSGASRLLGGVAGTDPSKRSAVLVTGDGGIGLGQVVASTLRSESDPAALRSPGSIALGAVQVDQPLTLVSTAGSISATSLTSLSGAISLDASAAGSLALGALSSPGTITLTAHDAVSVDGAVTAGGDYRITAATVSLGGPGGAAVQQQANGAVTVSASGAINGRGALTLQSNADGSGGEALQLLSSAGAVAFAGTSQLLGGTAAARSDVIVRSVPSLSLGNVRARALLGFGSPTALSIAGDIVLGDVDVTESLDLSSTGGSLRAGRLVTAGAATLATPAGGMSVASLAAAGSVQIGAGGDIRLGSANSTGGALSLHSDHGDISGLALAAPASDQRLLTGFGRADLGTAASGKSVTVTADNGIVQLGSATAGTGAASATAPQIGITAKAVDLVRAEAQDDGIAITATGGPIRIASLAAARDASLTGSGPIDVAATVTTGGSFSVSGAGAVTLAGDVLAGANYIVSVGGPVLLGRPGSATQSAGGAVAITGGSVAGSGALTLQSNSDGIGSEPLSIRATGGAVDLGGATLLGGMNSAVAARHSELVVDADGGIALDRVIGTSLHSAGRTDLRSPGAISLGDVTVDQTLAATSTLSSIDVAILRSLGGAITLDASGAGSVTAGSLVASTDVDVRARGAVRIGAVTAGGHVDLASAAGRVSATSLGAGGLIRASGQIGATIGSASSSGGAIDLSSAAGDVAADRLQAATTIDTNGHSGVTIGSAVAATGPITLGSTDGAIAASSLQSAGAIRAAGQSGVAVGSAASSGSTISLVSSAGSTSADALRAAGQIEMSGVGVRLRTATATAGDIRMTGGSDGVQATGALATGRSLIVDAAGAAAIGSSVEASGDYLVRATSVSLGDGSAVAQRAGGRIAIEATRTAASVQDPAILIGRSGLTLQSGVNGGAGTLQLAAAGGRVAFANGTSLIGGTDAAPADILVTTQAAPTSASTLVLDVVRGNSLAGTAGELFSGGAIRLGPVSVHQALAVRSAGGSIATGDIGVQGAGQSLRLSAAGVASDIDAGTLRTNGGDIALSAGHDISVAGALTTLGGSSPAAGSIAILAANDAGAPLLTAGEDVTVAAGGNAALGTLTAGDDLDLAATRTITLGSAASTGAGADTRLAASTLAAAGTPGGIVFGGAAGQAGHNASFRAANLVSSNAVAGASDNGLVVGTVTAGSIALNGGGDVRADSLTAQGDVSVTAAGAVSGRQTGFGASTGGATISAPGQVAFAVSGDLSVGAVSGATVTNVGPVVAAAIRMTNVQAGSVDLTAGTNLQVSTVSASGMVSLATRSANAPGAALGGYGATAMTAEPAGATIRVSAGTAARLGQLNAGQGSASSASLEQVKVHAASATIGGIRAVNGNILIEAGGPLALLGAVETRTGGSGAVDPVRTVTIRNIGSGATIVGGTTADGGADVALDDAEMDRIAAGNVVVDSRGQPVGFKTLTIDANTGATSLRFLTTGTIAVAGSISGSGTGTLQLGGTSAIPPTGLAERTTLASQLAVDIGDTGTAGAISFANGVVDLRAQRIVFGRASLLARYLPAGGAPASDALVAADVANAGSALYAGDRTARTFLTAKQLSVSYSDYALFQNSGGATGGGVVLNDQPAAAASALALRLFSGGTGTPNSFALFGKINGLIGRGAGILPNDNIEFIGSQSGTRLIRVNQVNSRVNGCVLGSPDKGCLVNDPPRPDFSLYDQRQTQLFDTADDPGLFFNPLVGRGNEGLIVDIADAPLGVSAAECDPSDPRCPPPGEPK